MGTLCSAFDMYQRETIACRRRPRERQECALVSSFLPAGALRGRLLSAGTEFLADA